MVPPKLTLLERTFLPQIIGGLAVTGRHMLASTIGGQTVTVQYPEEQHVPSPNYRGVHRLNRDEQGRVKCVACMLCATACPAHCIDIVGATAPEDWPDREKYPESFVIDELRCIYCGMCEEACPVDAIELTALYDLTGHSREEMIYDKAKLLSVFDMTKDTEPMKTGSPSPSFVVPTTRLPTVDPGPPNDDNLVAPVPRETPALPS
jgi:NADH-quinone oxidoreductase subunit I